MGELFEKTERSRREAYLASSRDMGELERRMRSIERHGYPGCIPASQDTYTPIGFRAEKPIG
ncbi:DUF3563 family protein [Paraburkholderia sp. LEh10]|uniref:DUF3563 family protein n=1 Tax=Paraburkholderia sp. LEh10 TaxID=2821353 RepID=UPI001AE90B02|nr:DUF3563 family protein [Paraburkholderia sp. LEh10]MBP0594795.1 DUF3563 family protein [Paraburkholderia sp. LEh10]